MIAKKLPNQEARFIDLHATKTAQVKPTPDKIFIALTGKTLAIPTSEILYCKAESNYTEFHMVNGTRVLASKCLKHFAAILGESHFIRSHASYLVHKNHIAAALKSHTQLQVGTCIIPISKSRKKSVKSFFRN